MDWSKDELIRTAKGFLDTIRTSHDIRGAYIFGSCAKASPKYHSDLDLAIVLGTMAGTEGSPFDEDFEIFHKAQQYNSLLEVVCFLQEDFDKDSTALVKKIKKEGIRLF